eukprot:PhM_4_TR15427/c0_g1_i1/m.74697
MEARTRYYAFAIVLLWAVAFFFASGLVARDTNAEESIRPTTAPTEHRQAESPGSDVISLNLQPIHTTHPRRPRQAMNVTPSSSSPGVSCEHNYYHPLQTCSAQDSATMSTSTTRALMCTEKCMTALCGVCVESGGRLIVSNHRQHHDTIDAVWTCNEAGPKRELTIFNSPSSYRSMATASAAGGGALLVVLHCWDYYGYHLWICLATLFARQMRHKYIHNERGDVVIGLAAVAGMDSPARANSARGSFSLLWSAIVAQPLHQVMPVERLPASSCYRVAVVGSLDPSSVSPAEWRGFSREIRHVAGVRHVAEFPRGDTSAFPLTVSIIERKKNYHILNLDDVRDTVVRAVPAGSNVSVVQLEGLSVAEQIGVFARSHIVIGLHGNGLTWCAVMARRTVLIEIWPRNPYNGNYPRFARLSGVRYQRVAHGGSGKGRFDTIVNTLMLSDELETAVGYLRNVSILGGGENKDVDSHDGIDDAESSRRGMEGEELREMLRTHRDEWRAFGIQKKHFRATLPMTLGGYKQSAMTCLRTLGITRPDTARHDVVPSLKDAGQHCTRRFPGPDLLTHRARCLGAIAILQHLRHVVSAFTMPTAEDLSRPDPAAAERAQVTAYQRRRRREFLERHPSARKVWETFGVGP